MVVISEDIESSIQARAQEAKDLWRGRNLQMAEDRAMVAMTYKQPMPGEVIYLSNEARAFLDKSAEVISAKWPIITMPVTKQRENERRRMSAAERFLDGLLREVALRYRRRGRNSWLFDLARYVCMGSVCIFQSIRRGPGGEVQFRADLWDPIQVYPVYGEEGLEELYRIYRLSPQEAVSMGQSLGYDVSALDTSLIKDSVELINAFWIEDDTVYNAVLIDGKAVKPKTAHPEWGRRIPVIMLPAGGEPYRGFDVDGATSLMVPDWPTTWGQPIFAANRNVYKTLDMLLTWELRITRKFSRPILMTRTQDGAVVLEAHDLETDRVGVLPLRSGEDADFLKPPTTPSERRELLVYLSGAAQRGGLSNIAFGELGLELPGVAVERLLAATKSTLAPYVETAEFAIAEMLMGFLEMYRKGEYPPVTLNVKRQFGGETIQVYQERFDRSKIPDTTLVTVKLPMGLPDRKLQNMAVARTAIPGNEPLLDDVTVAEEILEVQDYELVKDRIAEMRAERDPAFQMLAIVSALRRRKQDFLEQGDVEGAAMVQRIIDIRLQQLAATTGGAGAPPGPVEARRRELRPEVAPPEETGLSPDEIRPQPAQTPQPTMEQRLRSMGLVPPRG